MYIWRRAEKGSTQKDPFDSLACVFLIRSQGYGQNFKLQGMLKSPFKPKGIGRWDLGAGRSLSEAFCLKILLSIRFCLKCRGCYKDALGWQSSSK